MLPIITEAPGWTGWSPAMAETSVVIGTILLVSAMLAIAGAIFNRRPL